MTLGRCFPFVVAIVLLGSSFTKEAFGAPSIRLDIVSPQGDSLGGGRSRTYTEVDGLVGGPDVGYSTPGRLDYVQFFLGPIAPNFDKAFALDISTKQLGIPIAPGRYANAERAAFASAGRPGLDLALDFGGCNSISGYFDVLQLVLNSEQKIVYFDVQFELLCEGSTAPLRGRFAYDASGAPISFALSTQVVPALQLSSLAVMALTLLLIGLRSTNKRESVRHTSSSRRMN